jgi:cysteine desulfurase NifS/selenium donor protein
MSVIYLDYNATTPISKEVYEAMLPYMQNHFGNPSSVHTFGIMAKSGIEKARKQVADLINCEPSEIIFTSGGTESNNYAIRGIAFANKHRGNHIITSSIEHPAVIEVCKYLSKYGFEITYLPVNEFGIIDIDDFKKAITDKTILASIMHSNNEVGSTQNIEELNRIAKEKNIVFHTDAAQSIGKTEVDVKKLRIELLSIAGHKLYAPKGIGALYVKNGTILEKLIYGADHEQNMRAGTENVIEIVGLGMACEIARRDLSKNTDHYKKTRDYLYDELKKELPTLKLNGHPEFRLPNTLSISFPGVEANTLISRLSGIAASAGAACHSESIDVSAVLQAMAVPIKYAMGTIRFSTGRETSIADIKLAVEEIVKTVKAMLPDELMESSPQNDDIDDIRLTQYTHGLGCACKIAPKNLEQILKNIPLLPNVNILVGVETSDDAAVFKITDDIAIVQTLDFFTPIVDDPYFFGAIAAANALSDIYAMGATPLFGLNIVGFPEKVLPMKVLERILQGANDKAKEAGISILGGHTIDDNEPKYGLVVTGKINPNKIYKNTGAKPSDKLILTKAIGTGIISTGIKRGLVEDDLKNEVTKIMSTLNKMAGEIILNYNINACTDVTGFGLMGHLREMSVSSKCDVNIFFNKIPLIREVKTLASAGIIPGGTYNNLEYVKTDIDFGKLSKIEQLILCDAQTSGGLLIAVNNEEADKLLLELKSAGISDAAIIGEFTKSGKGRIEVK